VGKTLIYELLRRRFEIQINTLIVKDSMKEKVQ